MKLIRLQKPVLDPWSNFNRLASVRDELNSLFGLPFGGLAQASRLWSDWAPALDVHEDKDSFVVKAELPGMKKEDIDVTFQDGALSISGERKSETRSEEAEVYRSERYVGRFQRTVALPGAVAADKVKAQYKDGILTVTLPKTEEAKPKQINVSVG